MPPSETPKKGQTDVENPPPPPEEGAKGGGGGEGSSQDPQEAATEGSDEAAAKAAQKWKADPSEGGIPEIIRVIQRRNFARKIAAKMRKIFLPNSLTRFMKLAKVAKAWKKINFPFAPKGLIGFSKAKKIGALWRPRRRASQTISNVQNVLAARKFGSKWKKNWILKKLAKLFPKNIVQVIKFKGMASKWKKTGIKKLIDKFVRVLAANKLMKKWRFGKKKPKPEISITTMIVLKARIREKARRMRMVALPKNLFKILMFRRNMGKWKKMAMIRKLAQIPRSLVNLLRLKKRAKQWKDMAGKGVGGVAKIAMGIHGMHGEKKEGEAEEKKLERKDSKMSNKGDDKEKAGVDRRESKAREGLDRKESTMSTKETLEEGDEVGVAGRKQSTTGAAAGGRKESMMGGPADGLVAEEDTDEIGDMTGKEKGEGKTAGRGSVSGKSTGARGSVSVAEKEAAAAAAAAELAKKKAEEEAKKVKKTDKELRAERLEKLKTDIAEAEKIIEVTKPLKEKAEKEVDKLKPFYIAALETSKLSPKLILWIKSIRFNPPDVLRLLMEAICVLKGIKPYVCYDKTTQKIMYVDYWVPSRKLLAGDFLAELQSLRKLGTHKIQYLKEFVGYILTNPDFNRRSIEFAYPPAGILYDWIMSVYDLGTIAIKFEKRTKKLFEAEDALDKANWTIKRGKHEIAKIEKQIEREEKYNNKDHYTTKLTILPSNLSYTFTVTGSSRRRYEYDFVKPKTKE